MTSDTNQRNVAARVASMASYGDTADELLRGAIDIHHHGHPEITFDLKTRHEDVEEFKLARDAGMAAIVLKSHIFPTVGRAYHINRQVRGIEAIPSITLNPVVGGFNPIAIEAAARQGARVVFMPTWGAAHDRERGGFSAQLGNFLKTAKVLPPEEGLRVTDAAGNVKPEVNECLATAAEFGMAIGTAHISPRESIALAAKAKDYGINSVFFQHPDSRSVAATREETREMVKLGAMIELCALGLLPLTQRITVRDLLQMLDDASADQAVLTTDYFFDWAPSGPETLRMLISVLMSSGVSRAEITKMVRDNPARLLGRSASGDAG